jgi:glucokinase
MILYSLDVELIILGGSVRHAYKWFSNNMWKQVNTFAFTNALKNLTIEVAELENSGILGAAALYDNYHKKEVLSI